MNTAVGRKIVMSVTGVSMIAFVTVHLLGNSTLYAGPEGINAYAAALHRFGVVIWAFRLTLFAMFSLHVIYGVQLYLDNRVAKPNGYAVAKNIASTFAGRNMIWTGLLIAGFVFYHLLQFTFQTVGPGPAAAAHPDSAGRPDVFTMVVQGLGSYAVSGLYCIGLAAVGLHLGHSIQSAVQTLGLNSERSLPLVIRGGTLAALLIFLGFISIPLAILAGVVK
ncbi:MAG: succinate dehydrogenase cytochrome b subunit [Nitrospiraceae bacterium]|nr:succinate dehydrogenase cytochrome b subunit [Nitrospiraceae bacterium]